MDRNSWMDRERERDLRGPASRNRVACEPCSAYLCLYLSESCVVRGGAGGELPAFAHGRGRSGLVVEELGNKAVDGDISIRDLAWLGLGWGGEG